MGELGGSYESEQGPPEDVLPNQAALLAEREGISEEEAIIRLGGEVAPPPELKENEYRGYHEAERELPRIIAEKQRRAGRAGAAPVGPLGAAPGVVFKGPDGKLARIPTSDELADQSEDFLADLDDPYRM